MEYRASSIEHRESSTQNKPNFREAKMKLNLYSAGDYENQGRLRNSKNKPNQTQSNPILSAIALAKADSKGMPYCSADRNDNIKNLCELCEKKSPKPHFSGLTVDSYKKIFFFIGLFSLT